MRPLLQVFALSVLIGPAASLTGVRPAHADTSSWLTVPGGSPLFDVAGIAPGDSGSALITVTNPQGFPVTFSMVVTSLVNDDNGCGEPEERSGDTTCGAGGGELQDDLRILLFATGNSDRPIRNSTLAAWTAQPAEDALSLTGHESRTYRVEYQLPIGASNFVQSDLVSFAFSMRLDQTLDSIVSSDPPPVVVVATPTLPTTGTELRAIVAVAMLVSLLGVSLYRLGGRWRRSP